MTVRSGAMQFIPSTWQVVKVDADGDGQRNPQDMDDASLATAVYLCSGKDNLSNRSGQEAAVFRYNHSQDYVNLVLRIMEAYSSGDYTAVPSGTYGGASYSSSASSYSTAITKAHKQAKVRKAKQKQLAQQQAANGGSSSTGGSDSGGGALPSTPGDSGGSDGGGNAVSNLGDAVGGAVGDIAGGGSGSSSGGGATQAPDPVKQLSQGRRQRRLPGRGGRLDPGGPARRQAHAVPRLHGALRLLSPGRVSSPTAPEACTAPRASRSPRR